MPSPRLGFLLSLGFAQPMMLPYWSTTTFIVCKRFWDLFAIFLRSLGIISQRGVECKCILGKPGWTEGGGGGIMRGITNR